MAKSGNTRRGLGRGLSALMAEVNSEPVQANPEGQESSPKATEMYVPIEKLHPNPDQPRKDFSEQDLAELTASIREKGVIQPLIVRNDPTQPGDFQIVAGERRWRSAQQANLHEIPVVVRQLDDHELLEIGIIENIQRADLNPVEEALGFRQLMDRFGRTQEQMSEALGKSRSHIANQLRLLALPEEVLRFLRDGKLTSGHARALITAEQPVELAKQIIKKGLSVRQVEKLAKGTQPASIKRRKSSGVKDADTKALEQDLSANLGMKVAIDHSAGRGAGSVVINYANLDQLDLICQILSANTNVVTD